MAKSKTRKTVKRVIKNEVDLLLRRLHDLLEGFEVNRIDEFSSPDIRADFVSFEVGVLPQLPEQTRLFQLALPDFCPRVLLFEKTANEGWELTRSLTGHPCLYLEGSKGVLAATAKALAAEAKQSCVMGVWLCPIPSELPGLIAVVIHRSGEPHIYLSGPDRFSRIPSTPTIFNSLTDSIDQFYGDLLSFIKTVGVDTDSGVSTAVAAEERRRLRMSDTPDANPGNRQRLLALEQIVQAAADPQLAESVTMARLMRDVTTHYEKKLREAKDGALRESALVRDTAIKRLRADVDKQKLMTTGAIARATRLEEELKRYRQSTPQPQVELHAVPTLGLGTGLTSLFASLATPLPL